MSIGNAFRIMSAHTSLHSSQELHVPPHLDTPFNHVDVAYAFPTQGTNMHFGYEVILYQRLLEKDWSPQTQQAYIFKPSAETGTLRFIQDESIVPERHIQNSGPAAHWRRVNYGFTLLRESILNDRMVDLDNIYRVTDHNITLERFRTRDEWVQAGVVLYKGEVEIFGRDGCLLNYPDIKTFTANGPEHEYARDVAVEWHKDIVPLMLLCGVVNDEECDNQLEVVTFPELGKDEKVLRAIFPNCIIAHNSVFSEEDRKAQIYKTRRIVFNMGATDITDNPWVPESKRDMTLCMSTYGYYGIRQIDYVFDSLRAIAENARRYPNAD